LGRRNLQQSPYQEDNMTEDRLTLIRTTAQAFVSFYSEAMQESLIGSGLTGPAWYVSYLAHGLGTDSISAEQYHTMHPYTNIERQRTILQECVQNGVLEPADAGVYALTDHGRHGLHSFLESAAAAIAPLQPLSAEQLDYMAALLADIVATTIAAPLPRAKPHLEASRRVAPGPDAPTIVHIDQYLTDLQQYRDSAHCAAWLPHKVEGYVWEAFTRICEGEADSAESLADLLSEARGHTLADYTQALMLLKKKHWLDEIDKRYEPSELGLRIYSEVEATTDEFYYVGWDALNNAQTEELIALLQQLRENLQNMYSDQVVEARDDLNGLLLDVVAALGQAAGDTYQDKVTELDMNGPAHLFCLILAMSFDPEPVNGAIIHHRFPYSTTDRWDAAFAALAARDLLVKTDDDTYFVTDDGRAISDEITTAFYAGLRDIEAQIEQQMPSVELEQLNVWLQQITGQCQQAPTPPGTFCIDHSLSRAHSYREDAPLLGKLDQAFDDCNAFRDDAHLATFADYPIAGHGWEIFTLIWRGTVDSAEEMAEKMAFRGHSAESYQQQLDHLTQLGWIKPDGYGRYEMTRNGKLIRNSAETNTERYFYAPWTVLNNATTDRLRQALIKLSVALKTVP
jgi:hypothetical protein